MVEKEKRVRILKKVIQIIPWVIGLLLILAISFVLAHDTDITAEELARYAPKNDWLAAVFLIVLYAVKSLTYVLPIPLLYISSGLIFRPAVAFLVNVLGMTVCISLPYCIGRYSGGGMIKKLMKRFPKLQLLDNFKSDNEWFFSFIVRVIGFFPCDAVSVFMGAFHVDFKKYVTGTLVGMRLLTPSGKRAVM